MTLQIKRVRAMATLPERATEGSAGLDLRACTTEETCIMPGETAILPTGLAVALPAGSVGLVFGRSGLGIRHGIVPANAVGVIDADYRGEILVGLTNHSAGPYIIVPGDRIAQLLILPVLLPQIKEVDNLSETIRGEGGFGSTGKE